MKYKYSVIIPVYNAEKTLQRCVESLINQRYENVEIILVNDGSQDKSGEICKEYSSKHKNIKYISQANAGVSVARNNGLLLATGTYVMFVDSDDFVAENYFSIIDQEIDNKNCDLLQFSHIVVNGDIFSKKTYSPFFSDDHSAILQKLSDMICRKTINSPCMKVYKREIIEKHQVKFTIGASIAEDWAFNIKYALHVASICVIESALYYVCLENINSLSRKKNENIEQELQCATNDVLDAIANCEWANADKQIILDALNFGECRSVYRKAKDLHKEGIDWLNRNIQIRKYCIEINERNYSYPETGYCQLLTLPVRWKITWIIDFIAWKLTH